MKKINSICTVLLFIALPFFNALGQSKIVIDELIQSNDGTKTYIIVNSLVIKPGAIFTATSSDSYVFKLANPDTKYFPPSLDRNFVRTESPQITVTQETAVKDMPVDQKSTSYSYIDGMGRKLQDVNVQGSPSKQDVIETKYYDANGHPSIEYLPYSSSSQNGKFRSAGISEQGTFYNSPPTGVRNDSRPFKENVFENSSLDRITDVFGPGIDWKNGTVSKSVKTLTRANTATESIIKWKDYSSGYPVSNGTYADNQLLVQETTDEDGKIQRVYQNLRGQVILSRMGDGTTWFDTYSIYGPLGNLMIVIQPEGVARLATEFDNVGADKQSFLNRWCFQYQYDDEQRQIAKWIPGSADWHYTVYDKWNRPVLTQTPAQRQRTEWTFTKYDIFNREIITGLWNTSTVLSTLRTNAGASSVRYETEANSAEGYTYTSSYPTGISASDLIAITYYDNYTFLTRTGWDAEGPNSAYDIVSLSGFPQSTDMLTSVKGYATGGKLKVLDQSQWLNSVTRYDKKYRIVQVIGENYVGGKDRATTQYDFVGKPLKTQVYHASSVGSLTTLREFEYDHAGRVKNLFQTTDTGPRVLMASNQYNELSQVIEKNIHSTDNGASFLQSVDMRYNIRGWLSSLNNSALSNDGSLNNDGSDLFGMELLYNPSSLSITGYPSGGTVPKLYNGNIAAIKWKADTKQTGVTPTEQIYGYDYDALNRLKQAYYASNNAGAWSGNSGMFNEQISSYDKNGNINGIVRSGKINGTQTTIDNLTHTYVLSGAQSNRLISVSDATANAQGYADGATVTEEYKYDASGNLTFDNNKSISKVVYNHFNLPKLVEFTRSTGKIDRIIYTYDGKGNKLKTDVYKDGTSGSNGTRVFTTEYDGEIQYDQLQNDAIRKLSFAASPEGRVVNNTAGYDYEYFYKDHQGNVRLTYGLMKETAPYRATMENPPAPSTLGSDEDAIFKNISSTRYQQVADEKFNYTQPFDQVSIPNGSSRTNAFTGKPIGPAKSLRLLTGDKVHMEAYATYNAVTGSSTTVAASTFITALATGTFGFASGEAGFTSFNNNAMIAPGIGSGSSTVPKAYLVYLFFNDSYAYVSSSAVSITNLAYNAFEKLERNFTASQNGYLYVYVANETFVSGTAGNVYFDEMQIVHEKNTNALQVTQASDYYPFGLAFNAYQAERIKEDMSAAQKNRYGFQGQEWQKDLDLGWSQFKWRMHDPAIGRLNSIDIYAENYFDYSPYSFVLNSPVKNIEVDGKFVGTLIGTLGGGIAGGLDAYIFNSIHENDGVEKSIWGGITEGAISGFIAGATIDATVETGGGAALFFAETLNAGIIGGAVGNVIGNYAGQIVSNIDFGRDPLTLDHSQAMSKGADGVISGAIGGVAGMGASYIAKNASSFSYRAVDMLKPQLLEKATFLRNSLKESEIAMSKILENINTYARQSANINATVEAVATLTYEIANQTRQLEMQKKYYEVEKQKLESIKVQMQQNDRYQKNMATWDSFGKFLKDR